MVTLKEIIDQLEKSRSGVTPNEADVAAAVEGLREIETLAQEVTPHLQEAAFPPAVGYNLHRLIEALQGDDES